MSRLKAQTQQAPALSLDAHLKRWSKTMRQHLPLLGPSPIMLYQMVYRLAHELTGTVLTDVVQNLEHLSFPLACGTCELSGNDNQKLLRISYSLDTLESLLKVISAHTSHPLDDQTIDERSNPLASYFEGIQNHVWDSLAKGRLKSARFHGYVFWERSEHILLKDLQNLEQAIERQLLPLAGMPITRILEYSQNHKIRNRDSHGAATELKVLHIGATAPDTSLPSPWHRIR